MSEVQLPLYQIIDWPENFETAKSKGYRNPTRVCIPNKAGGTGLSNVQGQPDGPAIYGIWAWIVQMCSRHIPPRDGWLTADGKKNGRRFSASELANIFRCEREVVLRCLQVIQSPEVSFIRIVDGQPEHLAGISQGYHDAPAVSDSRRSNSETDKDTTRILGGHPADIAGNRSGIDERKKERIVPLQSPKGDGAGSEDSEGALHGHHEDTTSDNQETEEGLQYSEAQLFLNSLFPGCSKHLSSEEHHLLSEHLPIAHDTERLLGWAYRLPRDNEGWALYESSGQQVRTNKPKHSRLMLLREFGHERDKWQTVRSNLGLNGNFDGVPPMVVNNGWTAARLAAAREQFGESVSTAEPFNRLALEIQRKIDNHKVKEAAK